MLIHTSTVGRRSLTIRESGMGVRGSGFGVPGRVRVIRCKCFRINNLQSGVFANPVRICVTCCWKSTCGAKTASGPAVGGPYLWGARSVQVVAGKRLADISYPDYGSKSGCKILRCCYQRICDRELAAKSGPGTGRRQAAAGGFGCGTCFGERAYDTLQRPGEFCNG